MKTDQVLRINHARRDQPAGGEFAERDPVAQGRVHVLEVPRDTIQEVTLALAELERLNQLQPEGGGYWGRFAVIARHWDRLEPLAALCRQWGIPYRLMRDDHLPDLHTTREGNSLLSLLKGTRRRTCLHRVVLKPDTLARWFRRRFKCDVGELIDHPAQAALAQFILESDAAAPGCERVVSDLIEALYEFGSGNRSVFGPNGPLVLLTAHRAKGLEFDHVLILDGGGWNDRSDDERRLFYVAITRARKTLTLCEQIDGSHRFIRICNDLVLRSRPDLMAMEERLDQRIWAATPEQVVLSWPGYFGTKAPIHQALRRLEYGAPLTLRQRSDGKPGWEIADTSGVAVTRMAQRFSPPEGEIVEVRVAAIVVRKQQENEAGKVRLPEWELVLPEIVYQRET